MCCERQICAFICRLLRWQRKWHILRRLSVSINILPFLSMSSEVESGFVASSLWVTALHVNHFLQSGAFVVTFRQSFFFWGGGGCFSITVHGCRPCKVFFRKQRFYDANLLLLHCVLNLSRRAPTNCVIHGLSRTKGNDPDRIAMKSLLVNLKKCGP